MVDTKPIAVNARATEKPKPLDLSHHLSKISAARTGSSVKELYKYFQIPGIANLAGGLPFPALFPFDTLESSVATPNRFPSGSSSSSRAPAPQLPRAIKEKPDASSTRVLVPHESSQTDLEKKIDLATALQYGTAAGYPPLRSFILKFAFEQLHPSVPYDAPEIILTCGNTDGFSKVIQMIGERGDSLLVEEVLYTPATHASKPLGIGTVPVGMDAQGMRVEGERGLREVLEGWDEARMGKRPSIMYTVPIGQNPTGGNLGVQRRKEIYALCQKYDIIIVEDDPYWYIQFRSTSNSPESAVKDSEGAQPSSGYPFLDSLIPSYLSIDTDGRVIRLDTFSKTIAPGCRLGWITAQPLFIERLERATECSTQQPSGFVQSMVAKLLIGNWGMDGWVRWLEGLRNSYEERMRVVCEILLAEQHDLSTMSTSDEDSSWEVVERQTPIYSFDVPMGGMFLWLRINTSTHPLYDHSTKSKRDLMTKLWIFLTTERFLVILSPGWMFAANEKVADELACEYFRFCYAAIEVRELVAATKRTVEGIRAFWQIRSRKEMDRIGEDADSEMLSTGLRYCAL